MKNKDFFTVKNNAVDISLNVKDFNTPPVVLPLEVGQFLHVGYYKPFRQMYFDFSVLNTEDADVIIEYYDGANWVELETAIDETMHFTKSGFVYWLRPIDWSKTTIDSDELFYIRYRVDANLSALTELNGVNVLLSNDNDLIGIRSNIVSKHNNGNTWIEKHEAARRYVIQQLRNLGHRKIKVDEQSPFYFVTNKDASTYSNLTQFDLLEPFELREAAKFYALSYIYLDELSDENDDKWERAGLRHEKRADEAMNVFMLKIDNDDDGEEDSNENEGDTGTNLSWE